MQNRTKVYQIIVHWDIYMLKYFQNKNLTHIFQTNFNSIIL